MGDKKKSKGSLPPREPILAALLDGPDADAVLRLSVTAEPDGHWVIAATIQLRRLLAQLCPRARSQRCETAGSGGTGRDGRNLRGTRVSA